MDSFTLSVRDLRRATGWGAHRARSIISQPYRLAHKLTSPGPKGGGRFRLFRLSDLIARCREKTSFTQDMALALVQLDAQRRKENK